MADFVDMGTYLKTYQRFFMSTVFLAKIDTVSKSSNRKAFSRPQIFLDLWTFCGRAASMARPALRSADALYAQCLMRLIQLSASGMISSDRVDKCCLRVSIVGPVSSAAVVPDGDSRLSSRRGTHAHFLWSELFWIKK